MEEKIRIFASLHKPFMDMLLHDTWLTEEPISLEETKACWMWAGEIGEEVVSVEDFETVFKFSLQELHGTIAQLVERWTENPGR